MTEAMWSIIAGMALFAIGVVAGYVDLRRNAGEPRS
jgi:hypothetical protein